MINDLNDMTDSGNPFDLKAFARYLPADPDAAAWGLQILDAGHTDYGAGSPYPAGSHPEDYTFTWEKGRVLDEYQLILITRGRGELETRTGGVFPLRSGDLFILFPGEWHRYRPEKTTGWRENWVGFRGEIADRLVPLCAAPATPVLRIGHDEELLRLLLSSADWIQNAPPGFQGMLAANTITLLARAHSLSLRRQTSTRRHGERMRQAKCLLLEHAAEEVDLPGMAADLGYSYSRFRALFKEHTGWSPRQYQLRIRVNRAKTLLAAGDLGVGEVAERVGFHSVYYFSRFFKTATGLPPLAYRNKRGLDSTR